MGIQFWGSSLRDHRNEFLACLTSKKRSIAEVDLDFTRKCASELAFFRDRRIDAFEILQKRAE
jgi:hypothetical protein